MESFNSLLLLLSSETLREDSISSVSNSSHTQISASAKGHPLSHFVIPSSRSCHQNLKQNPLYQYGGIPTVQANLLSDILGLCHLSQEIRVFEFQDILTKFALVILHLFLSHAKRAVSRSLVPIFDGSDRRRLDQFGNAAIGSQ